MANWVARSFSSIYEPMRLKGGAAYFELTSSEFIKNENYEEVPHIRFLKPVDTWIPEIGLNKEVAMYELLREPEKLMFLINPAEVFN